MEKILRVYFGCSLHPQFSLWSSYVLTFNWYHASRSADVIFSSKMFAPAKSWRAQVRADGLIRRIFYTLPRLIPGASLVSEILLSEQVKKIVDVVRESKPWK